MSQVGVSRPAADLGSDREEFFFFALNNIGVVHRSYKTWPAGARIIFIGRTKERFPGDYIDIQAGFFVVPVGVLEWRFRTFFLGHLVLQGCQLRCQLHLGLRASRKIKIDTFPGLLQKIITAGL